MLRLLCIVALASSAIATQAHGQAYELVWQDEFDGTALDLGKWEAQIGDGCPQLCGWGNNELEYYRAENASVAGGFLTITANHESFGGRDYTSARLRTKNLGDWTYGRFEMRARMPVGQGLWPAFWMLPTDEVYGVWAASGEIDIMEYLGHDPDRVFGTLHYGGSWPDNVFSSNSFTLGPGNFNDDFHVFALEWDPCGMRWYVDGALYATQTVWSSDGGPYPAPFDERFHLLLNLAVGGNLPGPPDGSTAFPQELVVDYVRVYQVPGVAPRACVLEFDGMEHANPFGNDWFSFGGNVGGGGIAANVVDLPPLDGCNASLESGWGSGGTPGFFGGFGRTHPLDLSGLTHFTMWILPDAGQSYTLEINLQDDDNGDNSIPISPNGADDEFQFDLLVSPSGSPVTSGGGWQRVSIPLTDFFDDNSFHFGGNGIFDPVPTGVGGNGQLVNVAVTVIGTSGSDATFRTDRWAFTQQTSSLAGRVWDDANGNGVAEGGEAGINAVTVELFDVALGEVIGTTVTTGDGDYSFDTLLDAAYEVRVDASTLPAGVVASFDPDGAGTADAYARALGCDEQAASLDFGYADPTNTTPVAPAKTLLRQNVPNPFNPSTRITYELETDGFAELVVYDVVGRRVTTLVRGWKTAGAHRATWNGRDRHGAAVAAGLYQYVLRTSRGMWTRRMALVK